MYIDSHFGALDFSDILFDARKHVSSSTLCGFVLMASFFSAFLFHFKFHYLSNINDNDYAASEEEDGDDETRPSPSITAELVERWNHGWNSFWKPNLDSALMAMEEAAQYLVIGQSPYSRIRTRINLKMLKKGLCSLQLTQIKCIKAVRLQK